MPLKLTQAHSDYPTRGEALVAALYKGEYTLGAITYAGVSKKTIRRDIHHLDLAYHGSDLSPGGVLYKNRHPEIRALFDLLSSLSLLRAAAWSVALDSESDFSARVAGVTREADLGTLWPYGYGRKPGHEWFGAYAAYRELALSGHKPTQRYLEPLLPDLDADYPVF